MISIFSFFLLKCGYMAKDIALQIEKAGLIGRGCCNFPTAAKWRAVKMASGKRKFVVCNVSEGEPAVFKDRWILEYHPEVAIEGIKIALNYFGGVNSSRDAINRVSTKGIIYLRSDYFDKYKNKLKKLIKGASIELFRETGSYIGGEETALLNALEGKRVGPRMRPPYPTESGYLGCPTLVNNLETFYDIGLIACGEYAQKRLVCISGYGARPWVYELPEKMTVEQILRETKNYPLFPFFVQVGGGAAGGVFNSRQLKRPIMGLGSIVIHRLEEKPRDLFLHWLKFFQAESCGKCVPCREGNYRLVELLQKKKVDWALFQDVLFSLENTSFCGLGISVPRPILSYLKNIKNIKF